MRRKVVIATSVGWLIAIVIVWPISLRWGFGYRHGSQRFECFIEQGSFYVNTFPPNYVKAMMARSPSFRWRTGPHVWRAVIFAPLIPVPEVDRVQAGRWHLNLPLYLPGLLLLAVLFYPRLPFVIRRYRRRRGLCVNCGYDLTGNVSGVCPECGSEI